MLAKVFIQTYCAAPELAYGALLAFKTIRVGFPNAEIHVFDNGSIADVASQVEHECKKIGAKFTACKRDDFSKFYSKIIESEHGRVFIVDPDVIFWSSVEKMDTDSVIAGRLIPKLRRNGVSSVARLHPSMLFIPCVENLRGEIAARYINKMNYIGQYSAHVDGEKLFFDTLSPVYQMMPELCHAFTDDELNCYDHLFYGSHLPVISPGIDDGGMTVNHHKSAAVGNYSALKGIWKVQQKEFERESVNTLNVDPLKECKDAAFDISSFQGIEHDPSETVKSLVDGINIDPDVLEPFLLSQAQCSAPVSHHFGPGVYVREVTLPSGSYALGNRQKSEHLNIVIKGKVAMIDKNGVKVVNGPLIFTGQPGRKLGYVVDECVWWNVYPNPDECRDIEELERRWTEKSAIANDFMRYYDEEMSAYHDEDRKDYADLLESVGITDEVARNESENSSDMIDLPPEYISKFSIRKSHISGKGLFLSYPVESGELISPAKIGENRTIAGRYVNHAKIPNCEYVELNGNIWLKAIRPIEGCVGGHPGEELTVNYMQAMQASKRLESV